MADFNELTFSIHNPFASAQLPGRDGTQSQDVGSPVGLTIGQPLFAQALIPP